MDVMHCTEGHFIRCASHLKGTHQAHSLEQSQGKAGGCETKEAAKLFHGLFQLKDAVSHSKQ